MTIILLYLGCEVQDVDGILGDDERVDFHVGKILALVDVIQSQDEFGDASEKMI